MARQYADRAAFLFVYIQEAHPEGGWQMPDNVKEGVVFAEPDSLEKRSDIAKACCTRLDLTLPTVVDEIDNRVDKLYAAWPERIFIVDKDGKIAFPGAQGPWGFKPDEAEQALQKLLK